MPQHRSSLMFAQMFAEGTMKNVVDASQHHEFILDIHGKHKSGVAMKQGEDYLMVLADPGGGDLEKEIEKARRSCTPIEEQRIWKWLLQITVALGHLHRSGIAYSGVMPKDILLLESDDAVLRLDIWLDNPIFHEGRDQMSKCVGDMLGVFRLPQKLITLEPLSSGRSASRSKAHARPPYNPETSYSTQLRSLSQCLTQNMQSVERPKGAHHLYSLCLRYFAELAGSDEVSFVRAERIPWKASADMQMRWEDVMCSAGMEDEPRECVLCMSAPKAVRLICGHAAFCRECWPKALSRPNPTCPYCRESITPEVLVNDEIAIENTYECPDYRLLFAVRETVDDEMLDHMPGLEEVLDSSWREMTTDTDASCAPYDAEELFARICAYLQRNAVETKTNATALNRHFALLSMRSKMQRTFTTWRPRQKVDSLDDAGSSTRDDSDLAKATQALVFRDLWQHITSGQLVEHTWHGIADYIRLCTRESTVFVGPTARAWQAYNRAPTATEEEELVEYFAEGEVAALLGAVRWAILRLRRGLCSRFEAAGSRWR